MTTAVDPTLRGLSDCGCCEGTAVHTPGSLYNRPGLTVLARRIGTHGRFKASMLAHLSARQPSLQAAGEPPPGTPRAPQLSPHELGLTTRAADDFSIALLDAWAAVADVLAFYSERYAHEAYLRTATERLSILHLSRLIGYELRPGVAADAWLAFTLDDSVESTTIDQGARVQSLPKGDELPQSFETVEAIPARAEWNALRPRLTQPQALSTDVDVVILKDLAANLKAGDVLLVVADEETEIKTAVRVEADPTAHTTRVELSPASAPTFTFYDVVPFGFTTVPLALTMHNVQSQVLVSSGGSGGDVAAFAAVQNWPMASLKANVAAQLGTAMAVPGQTRLAVRHTAQAQPRAASQAADLKRVPQQGLFVFRQRAAPFGYNAPRWVSLPAKDAAEREAKYGKNWDDLSLANQDPYLYLDNAYPGIVEDSWVALRDGTTGAPAPFQVEESVEVTYKAYTLSAKVSRLKLKGSPDLSAYKIHNTLILAQSEELALADVPFQETIEENSLVLSGFCPELRPGQTLILTGECRDLAGVRNSEALTLDGVTLEAGFTRLTFKQALKARYVGATVTINANVARATHGETKQEALGSGDGSRAHQRFTLSHTPLTHVSAPTASGIESTLEVRVDGVRWREKPDLAAAGPGERAYVTRMDDGHKTHVLFGDGQNGARLRTGLENVTARYRAGIGRTGNLEAGRLTLLARRPPGVRSVTNPLAAAGGDDAEVRDQARSNAPLGILTLDRIVSLQDYEDFARAYAGVAKALATWTWFGEQRGVFLTVAGPGGSPIEAGGSTYEHLLEAMRKAGDPFIPLRVETYRPACFQVAADLKIDPDRLRDTVQAEVERALRTSFSFEARRFGQAVTRSEVMGVIQNVAGVLAVDLNLLQRTDGQAHVGAAVPEPVRGGPPLAAELLTLDPRPLVLGVLT